MSLYVNFQNDLASGPVNSRFQGSYNFLIGQRKVIFRKYSQKHHMHNRYRQNNVVLLSKMLSFVVFFVNKPEND